MAARYGFAFDTALDTLLTRCSGDLKDDRVRSEYERGYKIVLEFLSVYHQLNPLAFTG